jgi:hypothetical protein
VEQPPAAWSAPEVKRAAELRTEHRCGVGMPQRGPRRGIVLAAEDLADAVLGHGGEVWIGRSCFQRVRFAHAKSVARGARALESPFPETYAIFGFDAAQSASAAHTVKSGLTAIATQRFELKRAVFE